MTTDRSWIGRKYRTREAVDAAVAGFERHAARWEAVRDAAAFESPEYWAAHDRFIYWAERARELMPKGS